MTVQEVTECCQALYFPAEPYTIATFLTVHVALYHLFRDLTPTEAAELGLTESMVSPILETCVQNGEIAARNLRLFIDPTYENILALMMTVRPPFLACDE